MIDMFCLYNFSVKLIINKNNFSSYSLLDNICYLNFLYSTNIEIYYCSSQSKLYNKGQKLIQLREKLNFTLVCPYIGSLIIF